MSNLDKAHILLAAFDLREEATKRALEVQRTMQNDPYTDEEIVQAASDLALAEIGYETARKQFGR